MITITDHKICRLPENKIKASARINLADQQHQVSFTIEGSPVYEGIEPFLCLALLPAMAERLPIKLERPVSPQLLSNLATVQGIFQTWDSQLHRVPIYVPANMAAPARLAGKIKAGTSAFLGKLSKPGRVNQNGVACLFSGGVDSFYTLLKHLDEIDSLVFVSAGFDIYPHPDNREFRRTICQRLRQVARQLSKEFIEVEADLQDFSDNYVSWGFYHGAAMAALAQLLANRFSKVYFASSYSYDDLVPWGSHPVLDHLWSTEKVEIVHDGGEFIRLRKTGAIATSQIALDNLRVCLNYGQNRAYNCGECEKCIRTMVTLRVEGALERCPVFARPLDLAALAVMPIPEYVLQPWQDMLARIEGLGTDPELELAVRQCVTNTLKGGSAKRMALLEKKMAERHELLKDMTAWASSLEENNRNINRGIADASQWGKSLEKELKKTTRPKLPGFLKMDKTAPF